MNLNATPVILGIGTALPERVVTNEELCARFDSEKFKSFLQIAGIRERRAVTEGQSAGDLAVCAANALFDSLDIDRSEIDALIYTTLSEEYRTPPTACLMQHRLGLSSRVMTIDMVQACVAFIPTFATAASLMSSGAARNVLAIHTDALSQIISPFDRGLVPIHGDGAVAILYQQGSVLDALQVDWLEFGVDGGQSEYVVVPEGMSRRPFRSESLQKEVLEDGSVRAPCNLRINGAAIFHFVVHMIPKFVARVCAEHNTPLEEYDLVIFHQANKMMLEMLYGILKIPEEKRFTFMEKVGNMSGASVPFTLAEALRAGRVRKGSRILLCGFGAGLSWGAVSFRWQSTPCAVPATAILK